VYPLVGFSSEWDEVLFIDVTLMGLGVPSPLYQAKGYGVWVSKTETTMAFVPWQHLFDVYFFGTRTTYRKRKLGLVFSVIGLRP